MRYAACTVAKNPTHNICRSVNPYVFFSVRCRMQYVMWRNESLHVVIGAACECEFRWGIPKMMSPVGLFLEFWWQQRHSRCQAANFWWNLSPSPVAPWPDVGMLLVLSSSSNCFKPTSSAFSFCFPFCVLHCMPKLWSSNHSAQFLKGHTGIAKETENRVTCHIQGFAHAARMPHATLKDS